MKNNKLFNKSFILVTVLFTAFVVLASCSNADSPKATKKNNLDSPAQGIVVSGSFAFDGMFASNASAGRSAAPSFSEYNVDDYYGEVSAYAYRQVQMGGGGGKPGELTTSTWEKDAYPSASGTVNLETKKWRISIPYSGKYVMEIKLYKKVNGDIEAEPVLTGESSAEIIVFDANTISSHLNGSIAWPGAPVSLLPNPAYTNDQDTVQVYESGGSYNTRVRKFVDVPVVLKFRYPTASNITAISSSVYSFPFTYDTLVTTYNDVEFFSETTGDNDEITLVTISGTKKMNEVREKDNYHHFYDPEPYSGSDEGLIQFKDASGKVVYSCNEAITLIPGFTTDTWYWDDENDPHYYKDSNNVTYFNITQEMLDEYEQGVTYKMDTGYDSSNHEYPVVLFDNDPESYGYSLVKNWPEENATLADGLTLARSRKVLDFAIAPVDSNTRKSSNDNVVFGITNNYSTKEQQIFTAEQDSAGNVVIVRYPSYTGYNDGEIVGYLDTDDDVLSMYAAYDGYIYLLLGDKGSLKWGSPTTVNAIKRVCVTHNCTDPDNDQDLFGSVQEIVFKDGDTEKTFNEVFGNTQSTAMFYKLAAYNFDNQRNYMYISYVDNTDYYEVKLCCDRIAIPTTYNGDSTVSIDISNIERFSKELSVITADNRSSVFNNTYVSDIFIRPEKINNNNPQDASMYLLLHAVIDDDGYSYGGIVKVEFIAETGDSETARWDRSSRYEEINKSDESDPTLFIRGWYTDETFPFPAYDPEDVNSIDYENNFLYGPTKFIARKPDEIIIADEKSYKYFNGSYMTENEDRVVSINIMNFSDRNYSFIKSARTVSTKFKWEIEVTCDGTNYIEY